MHLFLLTHFLWLLDCQIPLGDYLQKVHLMQLLYLAILLKKKYSPHPTPKNPWLFAAGSTIPSAGNAHVCTPHIHQYMHTWSCCSLALRLVKTSLSSSMGLYTILSGATSTAFQRYSRPTSSMFSVMKPRLHATSLRSLMFTIWKNRPKHLRWKWEDGCVCVCC